LFILKRQIIVAEATVDEAVAVLVIPTMEENQHLEVIMNRVQTLVGVA
jgi:hypothetical protein